MRIGFITYFKNRIIYDCVANQMGQSKRISPYSLKPKIMKKGIFITRTLAIVTIAFSILSCDMEQLASPQNEMKDFAGAPSAAKAPKGTFFYGLGENNEITGFTSGNPLKEHGTVSITGLQTSETILAIDYRPATGQLYGVSDMSRLYIINPTTGVATAVSMTPFTPAIAGTNVGFDFNPTVDRIRLVTDQDQNLRLNPNTGAVAATDLPLNPGNPEVVAVAYINSFAGATSTVLYDINVADDMLYRQFPPNNGTLVPVGPLGVLATGEGGFDISSDNSVALAVLFGRGDDGEGGEEISNGNKIRFYYIDLASGDATNAGKTDRVIIGIAIPPSI